jgi:hypothetical protein
MATPPPPPPPARADATPGCPQVVLDAIAAAGKGATAGKTAAYEASLTR